MPLQLIWNDRPDLRKNHDITRTSGRISFLVWWFNFGHKEYVRVLCDLIETWSKCNFTARMTNSHFQVPLADCHRANDLKDRYVLDTKRGWLAALAWWQQFGFKEFSVPAWSLRNNFTLRGYSLDFAAYGSKDSVGHSMKNLLSHTYFVMYGQSATICKSL
ncbi:MAG: hypothetical protein R3E42_05505 [Burkholderiaceae bacterium]